LIGPDLSIPINGNEVSVIPVDKRYYEELIKAGTNLPQSSYLKIDPRLLSRIELINIFHHNERYFIGPMMRDILGLYVTLLGQNPRKPMEEIDRQMDEFQNSLFTEFEDELDKRQKAFLFDQTTPADQSKVFQSLFAQNYENKFDSFRASYSDQIDYSLLPEKLVELPHDIPATAYFKAGLKCKLNVI